MKGNYVYYKKKHYKFGQEYLDSSNTHFLFFSDGKRKDQDTERRNEQYEFFAEKIYTGEHQIQGGLGII